MARGKVTEAVLNWILYTFLGKPFPKLQGQPQEGKWYTIKIPGAKCSDGSPWEGYFKKGKENRVIVCFYGGGVSVDAYTAARPHTAPGGFYNPRVTDGQIVMANCEKIMGITGSGKKNPFRDWSVITIPYDNGDFHAGTGELEYKALDGSRQIMYYHGYTNYRSLLETCIPWLEGTPEALLITGGSAGGFGTALLADDVISHFPKTKNITVLVDSSVLICDRWPEIAR